MGLNDAAPLYRNSPEAQEAKAKAAPVFAAFMREVLPAAPAATRALAADLVMATLAMPPGSGRAPCQDPGSFQSGSGRVACPGGIPGHCRSRGF
jgi:hypothetical protein